MECIVAIDCPNVKYCLHKDPILKIETSDVCESKFARLTPE